MTMKKYKMTLLYYSSREVEVEADNEKEAVFKAMQIGCTIDEAAIQEIGKNAIFEGVQ